VRTKRNLVSRRANSGDRSWNHLVEVPAVFLHLESSSSLWHANA
jgi:hypothetical protein